MGRYGKGSMDVIELIKHYLTAKNKKRGETLKMVVEELKEVKENILKENENLQSDVIDKEARREIAEEFYQEKEKENETLKQEIQRLKEELQRSKFNYEQEVIKLQESIVKKEEIIDNLVKKLEEPRESYSI